MWVFWKTNTQNPCFFIENIVVAGFRRLNRARQQLFRGDDHAMRESRIQLRAQIEANRSAPTSGPIFEELVRGLDEATHMLKHEIVRGDLNEETGRYGKFILFWIRFDLHSQFWNIYRETFIHLQSLYGWSYDAHYTLSLLTFSVCVFVPDVKIKREHVKGSASGDIKPEIEPITEDTVRRMENPGSVQVCKSSASAKIEK